MGGVGTGPTHVIRTEQNRIIIACAVFTAKVSQLLRPRPPGVRASSTCNDSAKPDKNDGQSWPSTTKRATRMMQRVRNLIIRYWLIPKPKIQRHPRLKLDDGQSSSSGSDSFDHSLWDALLKQHVSPGTRLEGGVITSTVDYEKLSADPRFDQYLQLLAEVDFENLSPAEQLALLMNAYNAFCIGHVVNHLRSKDVDSPFALVSITALKRDGVAVWDLPAGILAGRSVTLGELEHTWLRGNFDEPGLHFAIVCASASCPDLRSEAYTGDPGRLRAQLADQATSFFANVTKGLRVEAEGGLTASPLLWWYADDFGGAEAALRWMADALPASMESVASKVRRRGPCSAAPQYFAYDWSLNRTPPPLPHAQPTQARD